ARGRGAEAERQWGAALQESPRFLPPWLGLGDTLLTQQRWPELAEVVARMEAQADGAADFALEAVLLKARGHLGRAEFAEARRLLEEAGRRFPGEVRPRRLLAQAPLHEGRVRGAGAHLRAR